MLWSLNNGLFWSVQITWPSWPLVGQYRSSDSIASLWLVNTGHVTQLLISDWSYLKCLFPPLKLPPLKLPDPKSGLLLIPLFNGFHLGVARETVTIAARSWNYHLIINYYLHFFSKICVITKRHFMLSTMLTTKQSLRDWCCCESHREFYTSHPSTLEKRSTDQSQSSIPALDQSQPELSTASRASRGNRRSGSIAR